MKERMKGKYILGNRTKEFRLQTQIEILNEKLKQPQNEHNRNEMIEAIERRKKAIEFIKNHYRPVKWTEVKERFRIVCW